MDHFVGNHTGDTRKQVTKRNVEPIHQHEAI